MTIIKEAQSDGSYDRATKYVINVDLEAMKQRLEDLGTQEERIELLKYAYPYLYILILKRLGVDLAKVMEEAKDLHKEPEYMPVWFHLWWLPLIDDLKQQNKIKKGKKEVKVLGKCTYEGDLKDGKCFGVGTAIAKDGTKYSGTWMDDQRHGVSKCTAQHPKNTYSHHHCRYIHTH